jgi:hypothetical protein
MSEKKKHHSFRVKLPAREVMRRLQFYADVNPFSKVDIHTIDVTGYDLISNGTPISLREDAESNETIVFIEDDGSTSNKNLATTYEQYLTRNEYLHEPASHDIGDKKKHHSFRVKLHAQEVMRRLQEHYGYDSFAIFTIDATGYDLIFQSQHISLREDAETSETIIFIEDDGFLSTVGLAAGFEHLLNGYTTLLPPPAKQSSQQLILDIAPSELIAVLDSIQHSNNLITFERKPTSHIFKFYQLKEGLWITLNLEVFQGETPHKTQICYNLLSSISHFYDALKIPFFMWVLPTLLFTSAPGMYANLWCSLSIGLLILSLITFIASMKNARGIRKTENQHLAWFIENIQAIPEMAKSRGLDDDNLSLFELENPLEMKQSHKG